MKKYLIKDSGKFYKAAMHVHTNISDGVLLPTEMKKAYAEKGYSIIAYTDHEVFVPHNELTDENFLALNAVEVSVNDPTTEEGGWPYIKTYHLNLYAKNENIDYSSVCTEDSIYVDHSHQYMTERMKKNNFRKEYSISSINSLIKSAVKDDFLVCYNHPMGSFQNYENYAGLKGLWSIEWFNTGSDVDGVKELFQPIEDLLRKGQRVFPMCGDDSHNYNLIGGCFTMIKADELKYDEVIKSLENGDFYTSTGPIINELYIEDGVLHISCENATKIFVTTERRVQFAEKNENGITTAQFNLNDYIRDSHLNEESYQAAYFRVTLYDEKGNEAHSNAYFLSDLI